MRDYLYCFFDKDDGAFYASGIGFKDIAAKLCGGKAIVLLQHDFGDARYDPQTRLAYLLPEDLGALTKDDIYQYGNFVFFTCEDFAALARPGVLAAILYFSHIGAFEGGKPPFEGSVFYHGHDDGWLTKIYAEHSLLKTIVRELGSTRFPHFDDGLFDVALTGGKALWIDSKDMKALAADKDMDRVITANGSR